MSTAITRSSPLVSIIIPHFNREQLLRETLASVQQQSYANWEALVVDDGSSGNSLQQVAQLVEITPKTKLIKRHRGPKGVSTCRNIGVEQATGDYILFLDSDDMLAPYCLEQRVACALKEPDLTYYVFKLLAFQNVPGDSDVVLSVFNNQQDLGRFLHLDIPWGTPSVLWRKETLALLGGWDEQIISLTDWDLHIRALLLNLEYQKYNLLPDVFVRRNKQVARISTQPVTEAQMASKIYVTGKLADLTTKASRITVSQKRKLAYLCLLQAEQVIQYRLAIPYLSAIEPIRRYELLHTQEVRLLALYLRIFRRIHSWRIPLAASLLYRFLRLLLPRAMVHNYSTHEKHRLGTSEMDLVFRRKK